MRTVKVLFLTGFLVGFSPFAPGTLGSLIGVLVYFVMPKSFIGFVLLNILSYIAKVLSDESYELFGSSDSSRVVIDEVLGMWLALLVAGVTCFYHVMEAFLIFRFLDIYKPLYVDRMERFEKGWGIILDDLWAGFLTGIVMRLFFV